MIELINGDCLEMLEQIPDNSVDLLLTDPPYSSGGLFAGQRKASTGSKYFDDKYSGAALHTILKNKKYMGTYVYDKSTQKNSEGKRNSHTSKEEYIEIQNGMPSIISKEDFKKL